MPEEPLSGQETSHHALDSTLRFREIDGGDERGKPPLIWKQRFWKLSRAIRYLLPSKIGSYLRRRDRLKVHETPEHHDILPPQDAASTDQITTYPFPFYGAGRATYYEWAEIVVRFRQPPTEQQIASIIQSAPTPLKPEESDFIGKILLAGSGQFINLDIENAYGSPEVVESQRTPPHDLLYASSEAAVTAFDQDIERWLREIHRDCPIEFAYRREDLEADGTDFSEWHEASTQMISVLVNTWNDDPAIYEQSPKEKEWFADAVSGVMEYAEITTLPNPLFEFLFPGRSILDRIAHSDWQAATEMYQRHHDDSVNAALRDYIGELGIQQSDERQQLLFILKMCPLDILRQIGTYAHAAVLEDDQEAMERIIEIASTSSNACTYVAVLGAYAYQMHRANKQIFPIAVRLYEIAIRIETPLSCQNLEVYCNALWILQKDNTGLPINRERNLAFLQKCLPYAPRNPAIYYNAACLYVEMEDFDNALEYIDLAMQNRDHYSEYDQMIHQLKTEPLFVMFRQDERVKQLLDRE